MTYKDFNEWFYEVENFSQRCERLESKYNDYKTAYDLGYNIGYSNGLQNKNKEKLLIVVPIAGSGSRFRGSIYGSCKPLIKIRERTMIEVVTNNLGEHNYIFIVNRKDENRKEITENIEKIPNSKIILTDPTDGPAISALSAQKYITEDKLVIINCDQVILDLDFNHFLKFAEINDCDGILGTFISSSEKNSYVLLDNYGYIKKVREKEVISNVATNGLHYWKNGRDFVNSVERMIASGEKYNNEYYIAPSYNQMIENGKHILPYFFNLHFPIGTPEDLSIFLLLDDLQHGNI